MRRQLPDAVGRERDAVLPGLHLGRHADVHVANLVRRSRRETNPGRGHAMLGAVYLEVDLRAAPPTVVLEDPDDVGRFHVAVHGGDRAQLDDALRRAGAGHLDGDHAFVAAERLRALATGRVTADWSDRFAGMLDYARAKGFASDDGQAVRAHLEWD